MRSYLKAENCPSWTIFQKDCAHFHMANVNKILFREYIEHFWAKGTWPANRPNLYLIVNIWFIMQKHNQRKIWYKNQKKLLYKQGTSTPNSLPELIKVSHTVQILRTDSTQMIVWPDLCDATKPTIHASTDNKLESSYLEIHTSRGKDAPWIKTSSIHVSNYVIKKDYTYFLYV